MCRQLQVPRSTFYAWRDRADQVTASQARRELLKGEIARVFAAQKGTAGCRRVTAQLNDEGHACSVGLVAPLMRELGLAAIQPRVWRKTTVTDEDAPVYPDLVERRFDPDQHAPGEILVGDITYLRTGAGWLYLAVVIDLATRMIVGWQMADHMCTSLVVDALPMARTHGYAAPEAIFHSDHGTQYASQEFARYGAANGFTQSMGRTGVCWDNAVAESFFSSLKKEMYHHHAFYEHRRARFAIANYIEAFYNRTRLHSSLGYRTPARAWTEQTTPTTLSAVA